MHPNYVLDACSLIAFFRKEKGGNEIHQLLTDAAISEQQFLWLHKVTLAEI